MQKRNKEGLTQIEVYKENIPDLKKMVIKSKTGSYKNLINYLIEKYNK